MWYMCWSTYLLIPTLTPYLKLLYLNKIYLNIYTACFLNLLPSSGSIFALIKYWIKRKCVLILLWFIIRFGFAHSASSVYTGSDGRGAAHIKWLHILHEESSGTRQETMVLFLKRCPRLPGWCNHIQRSRRKRLHLHISRQTHTRSSSFAAMSRW